ncbi:VanZ family protein [Paenibacillus agaridevorans]|uniref:VanZ family protein n=1 Tax=Paenibacillus agaridevorans TaxID=171404 RepID=A0A2R5EYS0_9BACL|nr:VanZ family protein [Paenibacillus agaridevorans]GBG11265.1 VanZ family protein [Paenibacillus agaridevorans]
MRKFMYGAAVLVWMAVIIGFSNQQASDSNALSSGLSDAIATTIRVMLPGLELDAGELNRVVRKLAHGLIYLVLGMLVLGTLTKLGVRGGRGVAITLLVCVLFAVSDELHQLFVSGRSGQASDVIIDSIGASIGILLFKGAARIGASLGRERT